MSPDTPEGLASRMRILEMSQVKFEGTLDNLSDDVREIKQDSKEASKKVDDRLSSISKLLWGAVGLLFTGFIAALGILVSQGGIH